MCGRLHEESKACDADGHVFDVGMVVSTRPTKFRRTDTTHTQIWYLIGDVH